MGRVGRHRRQQRERLETIEVVSRVGSIDELAVHDEKGVEEGTLSDRRLLDVVADIDAGVLGYTRVLPQSVLAGAPDSVGAQGKVEFA